MKIETFEDFIKTAKRVYKKLEDGEEMLTAKEELMYDFLFEWDECFGE